MEPIYFVDGIYDKNGKRIDEGDIIDIHQTVNGQNLFVITRGDFGTIVPKYLWGAEYQYSISELLDVNIPQEDKEIEIIGNINENPELWEYINNYPSPLPTAETVEVPKNRLYIDLDKVDDINIRVTGKDYNIDKKFIGKLLEILKIFVE